MAPCYADISPNPGSMCHSSSFRRSGSQGKRSMSLHQQRKTEMSTSIFRRLRWKYTIKMGFQIEKQVAHYVSKTFFCKNVAHAYYPERVFHAAVERILIPPNPDASSIALKLCQAPTSVDDFIANMQGLFNTQFLRNLKEKCEAFDDLCGSPLSDAFIGHHSYLQWATLIGDNCFDACRFQVRDITPMLGKQRFAMSQFGGSSDEPLPVTQIHLRGKNVKQAWRTNPDTSCISPVEHHRLDDWTPSTMGGAEVFHGTTARYRMDEVLPSTPIDLGRSCLPSQFFPPGDTAAIFTSFSVIRSFLWAAFKANVIDDPSDPTIRGTLRTPFQLRGQTYHGVIVIKFHSSQPAPDGLTHYQIPAGQESAWNDLAKRTICTGKKFWRVDARSIHGQSAGGVPDIVHDKDLPNLRNALGGFLCNGSLFWQTAWISEEAADALNARAAHVYVISFEREEATQSQSRSDNKKGVGEFARKFGHCLKMMMSSKDLRKR